jgi:hypothetical protein
VSIELKISKNNSKFEVFRNQAGIPVAAISEDNDDGDEVLVVWLAGSELGSKVAFETYREALEAMSEVVKELDSASGPSQN